MSSRATLRSCALSVLLVLLAIPATVGHAEPEPAETIAWLEDLPTAFERAASEKKILMVCINARNAVGEREEPAAKGLREIVYLDPAVVQRSREFVCVFLTAEGSSEDYGELRYRLGIDGNIISPQHIFTRPGHETGTAPLVREEYWSYGSDERAVKALLRLMDAAQAELRDEQRATSQAGGDAAPPASGAERAAWIGRRVERVRGRDAASRRDALDALVAHDVEGDCTTPLIGLLDELEKDERTGALLGVIRALGVPGLETATPALHRLLKHKDIYVRANTAVTLEYVGSASSADPLLACVKREKDEAVANHMYRAIGRCAAGDAAAKRSLLKGSRPGKEHDFGSFGPVIGLAYLEGDAKLARALEKQLLKLGPPVQDGRRTHTFLRALLLWCLSEIRDPETAPFLRKRFRKSLEKETSSATAELAAYAEAVAQTCEGRDDARKAVDEGIEPFRAWDGGKALVDRIRRGRNMGAFVPKGEWGNRPVAEETD